MSKKRNTIIHTKNLKVQIYTLAVLSIKVVNQERISTYLKTRDCVCVFEQKLIHLICLKSTLQFQRGRVFLTRAYEIVP